MNFKFTKTAKQYDSAWRQVASLWPHKTRKGWLVGSLGVQRKGDDGKLHEQFTEITGKVGDACIIKPNKFYKKGSKAPTHVISFMVGEPTPFKPRKSKKA